MELDASGSGDDVVAYQVAAVRLEAVPQDEQWSAEVGKQRFEKFDYLFLGDGPLMQPKAQTAEMHAGDQR